MMIDASSLALIGKHWRDPENIFRQQAIATAASEFCLSAPSFELAMDWIFAHWTEENIKKMCVPAHIKNKAIVQILAGTTPAMIAQGFLQGALCHTPQYLKIPRQQTRFASLLYQSFQYYAPELAAFFTLDDGQNREAFYKILQKAECIIAYGQDETIEALKQYQTPTNQFIAQFIAHGHAESAAIIFKEAANLDTLKKLADDMLSYDQRGCLSPRVTFVEAGGELSPAECAKQFAESVLPERAEELPRGGLFDGEAAEIWHQQILAGFRGDVYTGKDWTVCYSPILYCAQSQCALLSERTSLSSTLPESRVATPSKAHIVTAHSITWPKIALPRFMPFQPFKNASILLPLLNNLISIGYAGALENIIPFQKVTQRFCKIGDMQKQCLIF